MLILYSFKNYRSDDKSYLFLKNTRTENVEIIFEGHLGHDIEYGFIHPEKGIVLYSVSDARSAYTETVSLKVYDYNAGEHVYEMTLIEGKSRDEIESYRCPSCLSLFNIIASKDREAFCVDLFDSPEPGVFNHHLKCFRLNGTTIVPDETIDPDDILTGIAGSEIQTGREYKQSTNETLKVFTITPYSDYLPANYKLRYNGLYIRKSWSPTNLRISLHDDYYSGQVVWIENGTKLIRGSYLYDSTGDQKEEKLVDGNVIYATPY